MELSKVMCLRLNTVWPVFYDARILQPPVICGQNSCHQLQPFTLKLTCFFRPPVLYNQKHWNQMGGRKTQVPLYLLTFMHNTDSHIPLASISLIHISTTCGISVFCAFTSVVKSTPNMRFTYFISGIQSFGTFSEHFLCALKPQSGNCRQQGEGSVCDLLPKQWFIALKNNDLQCKR